MVVAWLPEVLKYIGSGALGAYLLTWARERRCTRDAYRRESIGEIRTATNLFMLRELEIHTAMTELAQHIRHLMTQGQAADSEQVVAATGSRRPASTAAGLVGD